MPLHILNSSVAGGNTVSTNYLMAHDFGISRKGDAYGYLRPEADPGAARAYSFVG